MTERDITLQTSGESKEHIEYTAHFIPQTLSERIEKASDAFELSLERRPMLLLQKMRKEK